jgi:hypothetical protein
LGGLNLPGQAVVHNRLFRTNGQAGLRLDGHTASTRSAKMESDLAYAHKLAQIAQAYLRHAP